MYTIIRTKNCKLKQTVLVSASITFIFIRLFLISLAGISQIKESISSLGSFTSPQHHSLQTPSSLGGFGEPQNDTMTRVGPGSSCIIDPANDPATIRRPLRLEALQTNQLQGKKSKKKKNVMNGLS